MSKNIWIIHPYATPPSLNGFNRPYEIGKELLKKGYKVKVFTASYLHFSEKNLINANNKNYYLKNNESEIPFYFIKTRSSETLKKRILNMMEFYRNLLKLIERNPLGFEQPDIVIGSSPHPLAMLASIKIAKKFKIKNICEIRDFWPEVFFANGILNEKGIIGRLLLAGEKWIYRKADALIFLKEGDVNYLHERKWSESFGGAVNTLKCFYINNGVNLYDYDKNIEENSYLDKDLGNNKFNVVYTGAIRKINNIDKILDVAKILSNNQRIQFLVYGEGDQLERLKLRVKTEGIGNVVFKGCVDRKKIPYILSKASLNLLNYSQSNYNWSRGNSSNKLFEYLASGKPVISTVKMGYCILEKYNCGFSTKTEDSLELANLIEKTSLMEEKKYNELSKNARKAAENFDYSFLSEKYLEVIERTINSTKEGKKCHLRNI